MKHLILSNLLWVVLVLCLIVPGFTQIPNDGYEDEYYEDGYEEEGVPISVQMTGDAVEYLKPESFYGYHRNVGGGVIRISKLLAHEVYINETVTKYDCVKKVDAHILALEPVEEEEEEEDDISRQVQDLRKKMEEVSVMAANIISGNDTSTTNTTDNSTSSTGSKKVKEKVVKVSFREKQELKMKERREKELQKELLRPKFRMGADCESLVCGSCKSIVEEFGRAVLSHVNNSEYRYVEDVMKDFCKSKGISLKYTDMVGDICTKFDQVRAIISMHYPTDYYSYWLNILYPLCDLRSCCGVCTGLDWLQGGAGECIRGGGHRRQLGRRCAVGQS